LENGKEAIGITIDKVTARKTFKLCLFMKIKFILTSYLFTYYHEINVPIKLVILFI